MMFRKIWLFTLAAILILGFGCTNSKKTGEPSPREQKINQISIDQVQLTTDELLVELNAESLKAIEMVSTGLPNGFSVRIALGEDGTQIFSLLTNSGRAESYLARPRGNPRRTSTAILHSEKIQVENTRSVNWEWEKLNRYLRLRHIDDMLLCRTSRLVDENLRKTSSKINAAVLDYSLTFWNLSNFERVIGTNTMLWPSNLYDAQISIMMNNPEIVSLVLSNDVGISRLSEAKYLNTNREINLNKQTTSFLKGSQLFRVWCEDAYQFVRNERRIYGELNRYELNSEIDALASQYLDSQIEKWSEINRTFSFKSQHEAFHPGWLESFLLRLNSRLTAEEIQAYENRVRRAGGRP